MSLWIPASPCPDPHHPSPCPAYLLPVFIASALIAASDSPATWTDICSSLHTETKVIIFQNQDPSCHGLLRGLSGFPLLLALGTRVLALCSFPLPPCPIPCRPASSRRYLPSTVLPSPSPGALTPALALCPGECSSHPSWPGEGHRPVALPRGGLC